MFSRSLNRPIAAAAAALAIAGGAFGIVNATSSGSSSAATAATSAQVRSTAYGGHFGSGGGGGSNARSRGATGGASGTVSSVSSSGFTLETSAGQKVTIKETSSTAYLNGTKSASAKAVSTAKPVLALGTVDGSTITASQVIVRPTSSASRPSSPGKVVPFKRGSQSTAKSVGQVPAGYQQGSGTLVSGTAANQATKAALAVYPGGIVDRVVRLASGGYEVHNIGVNWPHHVFVSRNFTVVGAD